MKKIFLFLCLCIGIFVFNSVVATPGLSSGLEEVPPPSPNGYLVELNADPVLKVRGDTLKRIWERKWQWENSNPLWKYSLGYVHKSLSDWYDKATLEGKLHTQGTRIEKEHNAVLSKLKGISEGSRGGITGSFIRKSEGGTFPVKEFSQLFNGLALNLTADEINKLRQMPEVKAIYRNEPVWSHMNMAREVTGVERAWSVGATGKGVTIAILDTGVDYNHPDLRGKVIKGPDLENDDMDPMDDNGHGTHVAGIAAGSGSYNSKYKGVAPDAEILAVKVLNKRGGGSMSTVLEGLEYAASRADVISLSLGGPGRAISPLSRAVDIAVDNGVVVVSSGGNDGLYHSLPQPYSIGSPAAAQKIIAVGATTTYPHSESSDGPDKVAWFSSLGPTPGGGFKPDVVAPGGDAWRIYIDDLMAAKDQLSENPTQEELQKVTDLFLKIYQNGITSCQTGQRNAYFASEYPGSEIDEKYFRISGTSMASPFVAGVAALIKQKHPDWNPLEIKATIKGTANDDLWYDVTRKYGILERGWGRVDPTAAVMENSPYPVALLEYKSVYPEIETIYYDRLGIEKDAMVIRGTATGSYALYSSTDLIHWEKFYESSQRVVDGVLGKYNITDMVGDKVYIKLEVTANGKTSVDYRFNLKRNENWLDGWPQEKWLDTVGNIEVPKVTDLNGDGRNEVIDSTGGVAGSPSEIYVWNSKGKLMSGWPSTMGGYMERVSKTGIVTSPAIGNLDDDPDLEIVYKITPFMGGSDRKVLVFALNLDGTPVRGWEEPITEMANGGITDYTSPVIADLDQDGSNEVIFTAYDRLFVYNSDKRLRNGWPYIDVGTFATVQDATPAVGDIDGDGKLEVIWRVTSNRVYAYKEDGTLLKGFPVLVGKKIGEGGLIPHTDIALGNLDNEPGLDIVVATPQQSEGESEENLREGHPDDMLIQVINYKGETIEGFPIVIPYSEQRRINSPIIADFDADGKNEIIIAGKYRVFVYNNKGQRILATESVPPEEQPPHVPGNANERDHLHNVILGDVNGDGRTDFISLGHDRGDIYAWGPDGKMLSGYPVKTLDEDGEKFVGRTLTISDVDGDGKTDIALHITNYLAHVHGFRQGTSRTYVVALGTKYNPEANVWPTYCQNIGNTCAYTGVPSGPGPGQGAGIVPGPGPEPSPRIAFYPSCYFEEHQSEENWDITHSIGEELKSKLQEIGVGFTWAESNKCTFNDVFGDEHQGESEYLLVGLERTDIGKNIIYYNGQKDIAERMTKFFSGRTDTKEINCIVMPEGPELDAANVLCQTYGNRVYLQLSFSEEEKPRIVRELYNAISDYYGVSSEEGNSLPIASFTFSPEEPKKGQQVEFDASDSHDPDGNIESYKWDFGDGGIAEGKTTTHKYAAEGTYKVKLTVMDNKGDTNSITKEVDVVGGQEGEGNQKPVAAFTYSPINPKVNEDITFDASESSDDVGIVDYRWNFGDGHGSTEKIAYYAYSEPGTYRVWLQVIDGEGEWDVLTKDIEVAPN